MDDILHIDIENPLKLCLLSHLVFLWVVLQVQEEGYESSRRRVAKYHRLSMRCPKVFHHKLKYLREYMRGVQVRV